MDTCGIIFRTKNGKFEILDDGHEIYGIELREYDRPDGRSSNLVNYTFKSKNDAESIDRVARMIFNRVWGYSGTGSDVEPFRQAIRDIIE